MKGDENLEAIHLNFKHKDISVALHHRVKTETESKMMREGR